MSSSTLVPIVQTISIASALAGAGGIAAISVLDFPEFQSQPAARSLPMVRWLFSRGSFIFPQAGTTAALGFVYLAYTSIPTQDRAFSHLSTLLKTHPKAGGYLFAASMALSILPFTRFVMLPNNMALMNKNAEKGGQRSVKEAKGEKEGNFGAQFRPQGKLEGSFSEAEEKEVREMMGLFISQNLWRAGLLGVGGLAGLWTALV